MALPPRQVYAARSASHCILTTSLAGQGEMLKPDEKTVALGFQL